MNTYQKTALLLLMNIALFNWAVAQVTLSDKAEIHALTMGPTQNELYSAFGHSAFRVVDPENNLNRVYNYGVFDFDQPNFYLNFARGFLHYKLDTVDYPRMRYFYVYYNRYIHEQVLNFSQNEKQQFFEFLEWNMLPENQYYYYDYFYDNCATRLRDALEKVFPNKIAFDGSYIDTDYTIRDLTDIYLQQQPWGDLGIDLCLGLPMDKHATPYMHMFLPDYIESAFNHATIERDGEVLPLVKKTITSYESKPLPPQKSNIWSPKMAFWSIMVLIIFLSFYQLKFNKSFVWFDFTIFFLFGLLGLFLLLLWVATDHAAASTNLNILWALPTHLFVAFMLFKKSAPKWLKHYFLGSGILMIVLILFWNLIPQDLHDSLIPITLLLGIRSLFVWKRLIQAS